MFTDSSLSRHPTSFSELTLAYWLLRLWIGLRILFAGVDKFKGDDGYNMETYLTKMGKIASTVTDNSFIPSWAGKAYAMPLGFIMIPIGIMILLGIFSRLSLYVSGLVWISLSFGLMALPDDDAVYKLAVHVMITAMAICLVPHNKFSITRS